MLFAQFIIIFTRFFIVVHQVSSAVLLIYTLILTLGFEGENVFEKEYCTCRIRVMYVLRTVVSNIYLQVTCAHLLYLHFFCTKTHAFANVIFYTAADSRNEFTCI